MKEDFALIIGINNYTPPQKSGLRPLKGAINDANYFEAWLTSETGGNLPAENCFKITSTPEPLLPLQEEIDSKIEEMIGKVKAKGGKARRLYFYFAGHGLGSMDDIEDIALCLAKWSELRRNMALSSELYKEVLRQFGYFEEIFLFADCCRNTKINVKPLQPTFAPFQPSPESGNTRLFIGYATQYQDQSFEAETGNSEMRGVFTKVLLEALKGAAADENGVITADALRDYLSLHTPIEAQKEGYKQKPEINHSFTSESPPVLTLSPREEESVKCHITFDTYRNSMIEFIGNGGVINTFDASHEKNVTVTLSDKLYLLRDTANNDNLPIYVSSLNTDLHVSF
ncbi:caspase domain-containing protein [Flavobacteriaceae bacterium M23B6Z8]